MATKQGRGRRGRLHAPRRPAHRARRWLVPVLVAVLLAGCQGAASRGRTGNPAQPAAPAGPELVKAWSVAEQVRSAGIVVVDGVVAAWECDTDAGEIGDCAVRGRDPASGSVRWTVSTGVDDGVTLVGVGGAVVASGQLTSLVIRAGDGDVLWERSSGILLGHTGDIVVLAEAGLSVETAATVVAIDVSSGRLLWHAEAVTWSALVSDLIDLSVRTSVPSGFWQWRYGYSDQFVMIPVGEEQAGAGVPMERLETRSLADGNVVAGADQEVEAIVGDVLVRRVERDGKSRIEGVRAGQDPPRWAYQLPAGAAVTDCTDLICVVDQKRSWSVVLTPDSGALVARADGVAFARRVGDLAAVLRCPAPPADAGWLCRPEQGQVDLVAVADGSTRWSAPRPLFVAQDGDILLLGVQSETARVIKLYGIRPGQTDPTHIGDLAVESDPVFRQVAPNSGTSARRAPDRAGDLLPQLSGLTPPTGYGLECGAGKGLLICGPSWETGQIIAWRYQFG
jgi:hypothetical protein